MGEPPYEWPEMQHGTRGPTAKSKTRPVTPVFGTMVPLRSVSGLLRRLAYRIPEQRPRRWLLLLIADRVDVAEHTVLPGLFKLGGIAALGLFGVTAVRRLSRG